MTEGSMQLTGCGIGRALLDQTLTRFLLRTCPGRNKGLYFCANILRASYFSLEGFTCRALAVSSGRSLPLRPP